MSLTCERRDLNQKMTLNSKKLSNYSVWLGSIFKHTSQIWAIKYSTLSSIGNKTNLIKLI